MSRTIKLSDVAHHAGVSVPTVSRVLRGVPNVAPELKARVDQSVTILGYRPNRLAKSLREQRTNIIGYLSAGNTATFHNILAQGIQDAALERGYAVITGHGSSLEREIMYAQIFEGYHVDGLIVIPSSDSDPYLESLSRQMPIVEVDRTLGDFSRYAVLLDNRNAIAQAVDHLVQLGHSDIGLIYGDAPVSTEVERHAGFLESLAAHGLPINPGRLVSDVFSEAGGMRATTFLLTQDTPPTALIVTTNEMLAGAVQAIRLLGLRLPNDVSLIGMDDARWTRLMEPPLTVIVQPAYNMGYQAGQLLIQTLDDSAELPAGSRVHRLSAQLIVRSSTAPPQEVPTMAP
ncbi:LacI family transcriptional regulator [Deinococcus psychrotolerans]|uniref:LacI family transcriptional regulator n=1 Tax=Deinococcus psychrotolerans TaxID=2489213 RepID=A0A3G8YH96_9DEIO|nr:LacI family DNA-binding transcriptional regulator [Deinococcus psychrotolerans]AZI44345.1 LacI family transcriptional regulator [Deinococcus psychrotolerans]